jgi:serine/threonine protein kinase
VVKKKETGKRNHKLFDCCLTDMDESKFPPSHADLQNSLKMEVGELKAALASSRSSIHKIVTEVFSHQYAGGILVQADGQHVGDGSKIASGSRLRFSMFARTHSGEFIQSLEFCRQVSELAVLSINGTYLHFQVIPSRDREPHLIECNFTAADSSGKLQIDVFLRTAEPNPITRFATMYSYQVQAVKTPISFKLHADHMVEDVQLTVHSGETWFLKIIIQDKEGQDVICSESDLRACLVIKPESCEIQADGSVTSTILQLYAEVSLEVGAKRKAESHGHSFDIFLPTTITSNPGSRGQYRLQIKFGELELVYNASGEKNIQVSIARHRDPREWSGSDSVSFLRDELEFARAIPLAELLGKVRSGANLYDKRHRSLWMWLGLSEDDVQLGRLGQAVEKLERLATDSDFSRGEFGGYLRGSIREGSGAADAQLEDAPFDHGGFADVYRGRYRGQLVAAKVLRGLCTRDFVDTLQEEARKLKACCHENVVACLGMMIGPMPTNARLTRVGLVMEYCSNGSLRRYVDDGKLCDWGQCVAAAYDVAKGLEHLHGLSMVHRDIKPENLLVSVDGTVKVCDFGLSKCKESVCHTAGLVGSPHWLAPEVFSQARRAFEELKKSDVWSFGAVLYFMISKTVPWSEHKSTLDIVAALHEHVGKMTCPRVASCPDGLRDLCEACCNSFASQRPSLQHVVEKLSALPRSSVLERLAEKMAASCQFAKLCCKFVATCPGLDLRTELFDMSSDSVITCYCANCCDKRLETTHQLGGVPAETYTTPVGWCELSFLTPRITASPEGFSLWHTAFHGTHVHSLNNIVRVGELAKAGDEIAFQEDAVQVRDGHIREAGWSEYIYMSPSMLYSGLDIYAKTFQWKHPESKACMHAQVALRCLIEPGTYEKVASTSLSYGRTEGKDSCIAESEIEWRTNGKRRGSHIITGLLVRLLESDRKGSPVFTKLSLAKPETRIKVSIGILKNPNASERMLLTACKVMAQKYEPELLKTVAGEGGIEAVINLLLRPAVSKSLMEPACTALECMTRDDADNQKAAGRGGGVKTVISVLRRAETDDSLLEQACWVLGNITCDDADNRKAARHGDGVKAVIAVLSRANAADSLLEQACRALANMTNKEADNTTAAGQGKGVEAVITILRRANAAEHLLETACTALAIMTDDDVDNRKAAKQAAGVEAVISVLKRVDAKDNLLEQACWFLANITYDDADNRKAAGHGDGVEAVIAVLRRANAADSLLDPACRALANITYEEADNQIAAGQAKGVEAVVTILRRLDAADSLLEAACTALAIMTGDNVDNRKAAGQAAGVEAVISVLRRADAEDSLLEQACCALANVTYEDTDNRSAAGRVAGVEAVLTILRRSDAAESLLEEACTALANMTDDNAHNREAAGRGKGVETVISVLRRADADDSLLEPACRALANITYEEADNKTAAGQGKGVEAVITILRRLDAANSLLEAACTALAIMTGDNVDNRKAAGQAAGVETVISVLRRADAADSLLEQVCCALANLTYENTKSNRAAWRNDGVEAVIAVLRRANAADSLLEEACRALTNMTHGDFNNKKAAVHSKGVEVVLAVMRRDCTSDSLQMQARKALACLNVDPCKMMDSTVSTRLVGQKRPIAISCHGLTEH